MAHCATQARAPGYTPLVMFKALLLQALYGLSERELEEALRDRLSFRRFVGLSLEEAVPDHTVLNRFRNLLIEAGFLRSCSRELDRQLEQAGVILKRGTMLDATLIEAAAARPSEDRPSRDPDARFTKRQGKTGSTFGYKAHVGVDEGSGLIRSLVTTPANVNDTEPADALIRGDERSVMGDAAYHTHARERRLKAGGVKARLMRRPNKHHPVCRRGSALQPAHRPTARGGRDDLRHPQAAHGPRPHPLYRPRQGRRPDADGCHRLQHAPLGDPHALAAPQPRGNHRQTAAPPTR